MPFAQVATKDGSVLTCIVRLDDKPKDDAEQYEYLAKLDEVYKRHKKFVLLYDARTVAIPTKKQLQTQIKFMQERDSLTSDLVIACCIVTSSKITRTILNGIFKIKPAACPLEICNTMEDGKHYLKKMKETHLSYQIV